MKTIIWLASEDWNEREAQASYHITKHLSNKYRILFFNSIGIRKPAFNPSDIKKGINKIWSFFKGPRKVEKNLWVVSPLGLPISLGSWVKKINNAIVIMQLNVFLKWIGVSKEKVFYWVTFPGWAPIIDQIDVPEERLIIHFFDRWEVYGMVERDLIIQLRNKLLNRAGCVLASGRSVYKDISRINDKAFIAPHGIQLDLFKRDFSEIPEDINGIPEPIVGFFGTINSFWIDFQLLYLCSQSNSKISWVFIGSVGFLNVEDKRIFLDLKDQNNVYFLGPKIHKEIPNYGNAFDIGILPFKDTELCRSASPLKVLEYLALGLPIVSTIDQQYGEHKKFINVTSPNPDLFLSRIENLLNDSIANRNKLLDRMWSHAEKYDWKNIVNQYLKKVETSNVDLVDT